MPITDEDRPKIREMSRRLASASAARVSDEEMPRMVDAVREISEGLMAISESPEGAASVAAAFASLLSSLDCLPVGSISHVIADTIACYGMVAGHLTGGFTLPEGVACDGGSPPKILFGDERDVGR